MGGIMLSDAVLDRLRRQNPDYHETAYHYVLSALQYSIERLTEPRHIAGRELAEACRDLALERWGPLARSVLEYWGIRTTRDLGEVVFALVEAGVLVKQDHDRLEEFEGVYDFEQVFEQEYPWAAAPALRA